MKTLVVNLFAGPGSGKSTFCASVFAKLKILGIDSEMSLEYAKDIVWEESYQKLDHQIYIFGKQLHRLQR
jgi:adenylate kinase family enzyme